VPESPGPWLAALFFLRAAHGFFNRHVKGLSMKDIQVKYMKEDLRPAVQLEDVQGADFIHVKLAHASAAPAFVLKNVEDFNLY